MVLVVVEGSMALAELLNGAAKRWKMVLELRCEIERVLVLVAIVNWHLGIAAKSDWYKRVMNECDRKRSWRRRRKKIPHGPSGTDGVYSR